MSSTRGCFKTPRPFSLSAAAHLGQLSGSVPEQEGAGRARSSAQPVGHYGSAGSAALIVPHLRLRRRRSRERRARSSREIPWPGRGGRSKWGARPWALRDGRGEKGEKEGNGRGGRLRPRPSHPTLPLAESCGRTPRCPALPRARRGRSRCSLRAPGQSWPRGSWSRPGPTPQCRLNCW